MGAAKDMQQRFGDIRQQLRAAQRELEEERKQQTKEPARAAAIQAKDSTCRAGRPVQDYRWQWHEEDQQTQSKGKEGKGGKTRKRQDPAWMVEQQKQCEQRDKF